jgi:Ca2+-binding RTX toxin-like protein
MDGSSGSFPEFQFTNNSAIPGADAQPIFGSVFGSGSSVGAQSTIANGSNAVPAASTSANNSLIVTGGGAANPSETEVPTFSISAFSDPYSALASAVENLPVPGEVTPPFETPTTQTTSEVSSTGYSAIYDLSNNDTLTGGSGDLSVFLQNNTQFMAGSGSNTIYAGGADTINAPTGASTIFSGTAGSTVQGGSGSLLFVGGDGAVSAQGGSGDTVLIGGTASNVSNLVAGTGNSTLIGGSGNGSTTLSGGAGNPAGVNTMLAFANGSGATTMVGPQSGNAIMNGTTGSGQEIMVAPASGLAVIALNNAADTVVAGGGNTTVIGGAGPDLYAFLYGLSGSEIILGFKASDQISFAGSSSILSEKIIDGSDVIQTTDGAQITLVAYNHKLFS